MKKINVLFFTFATLCLPLIGQAELEQGFKIQMDATKSRAAALSLWNLFLADCASTGDADAIILVSPKNDPVKRYCLDFNSINESRFEEKKETLKKLAGSGLAVQFKVDGGTCAIDGLAAILENWPWKHPADEQAVSCLCGRGDGTEAAKYVIRKASNGSWEFVVIINNKADGDSGFKNAREARAMAQNDCTRNLSGQTFSCVEI